MTKPAQYRVRAFTRRLPPQRGYLDHDIVHMQVLELKRWFGWQTIDEEVVPDHVKISSGALGDTGGWVSKFTKLGTFGRDGVFTLHPHVEAKL
ncbi:hypothetical protein D869_gp181 [Caulobacter phage CcrRogue]|uniref:Uncharacterized protein n=1 Tax=Caulobacter phage CcrRogue TaxID=2927986 RepID=K4JSK9_9CAUD|nr:hypothetical protein D869_gp181 [Caulobacter phage CcrRogue]AFU86733.1 hypothetical protein CcrRogue_gp251 [Caulobacter phage CcrRogue]